MLYGLIGIHAYKRSMSVDKEIDVDIDTVKELAGAQVLEKAYDDLAIPPLSRLAKCSVCYQERLPFGFHLGTVG